MERLGSSKKPNSNGTIPHHIWIMIPQWTYSHLASSNMLTPRSPTLNVVSMLSSPINIMSISQITFVYDWLIITWLRNLLTKSKLLQHSIKSMSFNCVETYQRWDSAPYVFPSSTIIRKTNIHVINIRLPYNMYLRNVRYNQWYEICLEKQV